LGFDPERNEGERKTRRLAKKRAKGRAAGRRRREERDEERERTFNSKKFTQALSRSHPFPSRHWNEKATLSPDF